VSLRVRNRYWGGRPELNINELPWSDPKQTKSEANEVPRAGPGQAQCKLGYYGRNVLFRLRNLPSDSCRGTSVYRFSSYSSAESSLRVLHARYPELKKGTIKAPFFNSGSPGRTRTCNLVVNSHPLCRLSYRGMWITIPYVYTKLSKKQIQYESKAGVLVLLRKELPFFLFASLRFSFASR
jgi:hypothetical protein